MGAPAACLYPQLMPTSGYQYGCRCARCLDAHRAYHRAYRQAHARPPRRRKRTPAVEHGVTRWTIRDVVHGHSWVHIK